jgi:hypothetical protein
MQARIREKKRFSRKAVGRSCLSSMSKLLLLHYYLDHSKLNRKRKALQDPATRERVRRRVLETLERYRDVLFPPDPRDFSHRGGFQTKYPPYLFWDDSQYLYYTRFKQRVRGARVAKEEKCPSALILGSYIPAQDIEAMAPLLGIADHWIGATGCRHRGAEVLTMLLHRLATPARLADVGLFYHCKAPQVSNICNKLAVELHNRWEEHLAWAPGLSDRRQLRHLCRYAHKHLKVPYTHNVGYLDCTLTTVCRSTDPLMEYASFNGYRGVHCIKSQSLVLDNGLCAAFGLTMGRTHDEVLASDSGLFAKMRAHWGSGGGVVEQVAGAKGALGPCYHCYTDGGYSSSPWVHIPYTLAGGANRVQIGVSAIMAKKRVAVENHFGYGRQLFAGLDYKKKLKLLLNKNAEMLTCWTLFNNMYVCTYGGRLADRSGLQPPSVEEYLTRGMLFGSGGNPAEL